MNNGLPLALGAVALLAAAAQQTDDKEGRDAR
jgi:hypothetical protein